MKEYRFKEILFEGYRRDIATKDVETFREYDIKVTMESLSKEEVDEFRNFVVEMSRRPAASETEKSL